MGGRQGNTPLVRQEHVKEHGKDPEKSGGGGGGGGELQSATDVGHLLLTVSTAYVLPDFSVTTYNRESSVICGSV